MRLDLVLLLLRSPKLTLALGPVLVVSDVIDTIEGITLMGQVYGPWSSLLGCHS